MQSKSIFALCLVLALVAMTMATKAVIPSALICARAGPENCNRIEGCRLNTVGICTSKFKSVRPTLDFQAMADEVEEQLNPKKNRTRFTAQDNNLLTTLLEDENLLTPDGTTLTTHQLHEMAMIEDAAVMLKHVKAIHEAKNGKLFTPPMNQTHRRLDNGKLEFHTTNHIQVMPKMNLLGETEEEVAYDVDIEIQLNEVDQNLTQINDFELQFLYDEDFAFMGDFTDCKITRGGEVMNKTQVIPRRIQPNLSTKTQVASDLELVEELMGEQTPRVNAMTVSDVKLKVGEKMKILCPQTHIIRQKNNGSMANKFHERPTSVELTHPAVMKFSTTVLTETGEAMTIVHHSDFKSSLAPWKFWTLIGCGALLIATLAVVGFFIARRLMNKSKKDGKDISSQIDSIDTLIPEEEQSLLP